MTGADVSRTLDDMGIAWDDPIRATANDFARRTPAEQNLWLFVEVARMKPSRTPSILNAVYTTVSVLTLAVMQRMTGGQ